MVLNSREFGRSIFSHVFTTILINALKVHGLKLRRWRSTDLNIILGLNRIRSFERRLITNPNVVLCYIETDEIIATARFSGLFHLFEIERIDVFKEQDYYKIFFLIIRILVEFALEYRKNIILLGRPIGENIHDMEVYTAMGFEYDEEQAKQLLYNETPLRFGTLADELEFFRETVCFPVRLIDSVKCLDDSVFQTVFY